MKSWLLSLGSIALGGALLLAAGCTDEPQRYSITFKQDDCTDVVFTVDAGGTLTPPKPKDVTGYTVTWDRTSFENITENLVVNAVYTPNEYTITYVLEEGETLDEYTQTVTYDAQYELKTPTKEGYSFDGWYNGNTLVEQSGVWKIASDVTLTAWWTAEAAEYYEIKFIHCDETEEIVKVAKGTTLAAEDAPACKQIAGYTVVWETTDFSTIRIVNAVKTANTYKISYQLEEGETIPETAPKTVVYGQSYQLKDASNSDINQIFAGWVNAATGEKVPSKGVWTIVGDVELIPDWVDAEKDFTQNH